jgi:nucleotidyltransferase/DNA polymerase involved in DNA repair
VSERVFGLFRSVTPLVEPLSLDEAYLDVTENAWGEPLGMTVARRLKTEIRTLTGLTASAGVAPNKFLAKIASGWQKPDGLTVIAPERVEHFLRGLDVDASVGVGPVTAEKLRRNGITRSIDVRTADPAQLRAAVGSLADWLTQPGARPRRPPGGVGTHAQVVGQRDDVRADLTDINEMRHEVARWRATPPHGCSGASCAHAPSPSSCVTATSPPLRAATRTMPTQNGDQIERRAVELLDRTEAASRRSAARRQRPQLRGRRARQRSARRLAPVRGRR